MKKLIKQVFGFFRLKVSRVPTQAELTSALAKNELNAARQKFQWLSKYSINKIVDIGSNEGQFASTIYKVFPTASFFCFEPIPEVFQKLKENLTEAGDKFKFYNLALGIKKEKSTIHLNEYSPSSSILEMDVLHKNIFTYTEKSKPIEIEIDTLDSFANEIQPDDCTLVKIDVQGFELQVLKGGLAFIKKSKLIVIEMSFEILYKEQLLFHDVYTFLHNLGFTYHGSLEQLFNPANNEILQADCLFVRT